jgi:hypothetical protein
MLCGVRAIGILAATWPVMAEINNYKLAGRTDLTRLVGVRLVKLK